MLQVVYNGGDVETAAFGFNIDVTWHHYITSQTNPASLWKFRDWQRAYLARYGRRIDLLGPNVDITELDVATTELSALLEAEGPDETLKDMG